MNLMGEGDGCTAEGPSDRLPIDREKAAMAFRIAIQKAFIEALPPGASYNEEKKKFLIRCGVIVSPDCFSAKAQT